MAHSIEIPPPPPSSYYLYRIFRHRHCKQIICQAPLRGEERIEKVSGNFQAKSHYVEYIQVCLTEWTTAAGTEKLTLGILSFVQIPSDRRRSRISHANIEGHSLLY